MGHDQQPEVAEELGEATGKIESKTEPKKDFKPSEGLTTAGKRRFAGAGAPAPGCIA